MVMEDGFAVGIDLGTTYCRVAVWQENHPKVIEDSGGNRMMASYVAFSSTQRFIGDAAESQAHMNVTNTVYDSKRLIGRRFNDSYVKEDIKQWPFRVVASGPCDTPRILVNYRRSQKLFTAEEICSMMLIKLKEKAESYLGETVKNVVITVPAYFNGSQRQATKDAAAIAGLNVMQLINEPTAAAIAYALDNKKKMKGKSKRDVLIFYLGGGTLEVSIVTIDGLTIKVRAVSGDTHLGGEDFDNRLVSHFIEELQRKHNTDISGNHKAVRKLRSYCEKAKRNLSFNPEDTFEVEALYDDNDFSFEITREQFQKLNMDLFEKCINAVRRCLQDAKINASSINDIVLVGGSTRIPMIQQLLQDLFDKKELFRGINTDEAVVRGAAIQAAMVNRQLNLNLVCEDVSPFSLSFLGDQIITCNSIIPIDKKLPYPHNCDKRKGVFEVYETGGPGSTYTNLLCEFWLTQIPEKSCEFTICFEIDENGILKVSAEPTSGTRIITEKGGLVEEVIEKMAKEGKEYQHQDVHYKKTMEARNALEEFVYRIIDKVRNGRISSKDKEGIEKILDSTTNWLRTNQLPEINEIESRKKEIEHLYNRAAEKANEGRDTVQNVQVGIHTEKRRLQEEEIEEKTKEDEDVGLLCWDYSRRPNDSSRL